jgi:hypothetical protein
MLITSMPAPTSIFAAASCLSTLSPGGGLTSTDTANFFCSSLAARRLFSADGTTRMSAAGAGGAYEASMEPVPLASMTSALSAMRAAPEMRRMCSGVVPQHPPTRRAPSLNMRRAKRPKYSGVAM